MLLFPERVMLDGVTYRRALEGEFVTATNCSGCAADFDMALCRRLIGLGGCYTGDDREIPTIWVKAE